MKTWTVGDRVRREVSIGAEEISLFSSLVGDLNPIHYSPEAARAAGFKAPIAHGMIAGSLFSEVLGNELPGPGSVYLEQRFKFLAPLYMPTQATILVEVVSVRSDQKIITVRTACFDEDEILCVDGEAILLRRAVAEVEHG